MEIKKLILEGNKLLQNQKYDEVIDLLRVSESNENAELAGVLSETYYERDTKGDIYAANFFATREIDLGNQNRIFSIIKGITHYRKSEYKLAAQAFQSCVNSNSSKEENYIYALSLIYSYDVALGIEILEKLVSENSDNSHYKHSLEKAFDIQQEKVKLPEVDLNKNIPYLGGPLDTTEEIDSPYESCALSKVRGVVDTKKDFEYLKKSIPCQGECPAHTDIPEYLTAVFEERYDDAYKINLRDNVFPSVLGRVCARPCESKCRHIRSCSGNTEPLAICHSKRASADNAKSELTILDKIFEPTNKKVAIIGGGVGGLSTARELLTWGHDVTVFEKKETLGGMMIQGIPAFRLPRKHIDKEIAQIKALGLEVECNKELGRNLLLEDLKNEYDAVVIATGTYEPNILNLKNNDANGVMHGLEFLLDFNENRIEKALKNVVVIGGGFTAVDCARSARRIELNGKSISENKTNISIIYRRTEDEMAISKDEIEELENENISIKYLASPIEIISENSNVKAVKFIKNKLGEVDASGRRSPVAIEGSEFEVEADLVLFATGQSQDFKSFTDDEREILLKNKRLVYNDFKTGLDKTFVSGDFAKGASTLIEAISYGKKCAKRVDKFLMNKSRIKKVVKIEDATTTNRILEMNKVPLIKMPALNLEKRCQDQEVELGFSKEESQEETQRCYRCHYKYEIDQNRCIQCKWCVKAKSQDRCIVSVNHLNYDENGVIVGYKEATCPEESSQIYIDQSECIRCGKCLEACPADAISIQKVYRDKEYCG